MSGLFEHMAAFDEHDHVSSRKAAFVAQKRIADRFGSFLQKSASAEEYDARLDYVSEAVMQIVADVSEEYDADIDNLKDAIDEHLKGSGVTDLTESLDGAPSAVGVGKQAAGHKDGCTCGFCKNKGSFGKKDDKDDDHTDEKEQSDDVDDSDDDSGDDGDNSIEAKVEGIVDDEEKSDKDASEPEWSEKAKKDLEKDSSWHTAEADRDGGGPVKRVDLPKGDGKSVGTGPSPKIDRKEWKPNALNPSGNLPAVPDGIEMSDSPNPTERQDLVDDTPDYKGDFLRDTDAQVTQQDLPSGEGDSFNTDRNISQDGQDGTWTESQNNPVTSEVFASTNQVQAALASFKEKSN